MLKHLPLGIIIAASILAHFLFFGHPQETVFDEVHFGKFISGYFTHEYFFDIHPPLGKLLISGMGYLGSFRPGFSFAEIGQEFPDQTFLWLRFLPLLAGILLPVIIFLFAKKIGLSTIGSFAAGIFMILEGSFLVQSRLILLDVFLLLFGFLALLFYWQYRHHKSIKFLALAGACGALTMLVKWTGATFLTIILVAEIWTAIKAKPQFKALIPKATFLILIPGAIYFGVFAIHLRLLNRSGPGDAFMSPGFQKTLAGNPNAAKPEIQPANLFKKIIELNAQMYKSNATLTATHPYSSQWYSWPFMARPIYYWYKGVEANTQPAAASRIYLLGNPVIWWGATFAVLYALINVLGGWRKQIRSKKIVLLLLGAYLLNLLPFIGIKRAMFLYHYFTALVFGILLLAWQIDNHPHKEKIFGGIILAALIAFIYFAPLWYGLPLTESAYDARAWFPAWK